MLKQLSRIITFLFHPMIIPSLGVYMMLTFSGYLGYLPFKAVGIIMSISIISTFVMPLSFVLFFYFRSITRKTSPENENMKFVPIFICLIFYFFCYYIFTKTGVPDLPVRFMLGVVTSAFVSLFILTKFNISLHLTGLGGLSGALFVLSVRMAVNLEPVIIAIILAAGLTGSSLLYREIHKPSEIYWGFINGVTIFSLVMLFC
ncbi:MAG: hypothetical protein NTW49_07290 [Bacteroidia bacterium]|nr:hypothetical protein [Bacteroidia bacterium]